MSGIVIMPCSGCELFFKLEPETPVSTEGEDAKLYCSEECAPEDFRRLREATIVIEDTL